MGARGGMAGFDAADPFPRNRRLARIPAFPANLRLGVPRNGQLIFFGDKASEKAYRDALQRWTALGATLVEFDLEPFYETARLLYEDRKSTRLNSSHQIISYAVFCLKKKN